MVCENEVSENTSDDSDYLSLSLSVCVCVCVCNANEYGMILFDCEVLRRDDGII